MKASKHSINVLDKAPFIEALVFPDFKYVYSGSGLYIVPRFKEIDYLPEAYPLK